VLSFPRVREEHLELILRWRSSPAVNAASLTSVTYDMDAQRRWFAAVSNDPTRRYWLIAYHGRPIGVVNLVQLSLVDRHSSAGFYIGEPSYRSLGGMVLPYLYNYMFGELKLHKMFGEVVASNTVVLEMHRRHGYREVGRYRDHLCRDGVFEDVVLVELLAETWLAQPRYRGMVAEFEA
jgi:UDP-4-amino-4,6-dideoxy-N-acetyl-beta-L-altrosamine N-acetyltransferase